MHWGGFVNVLPYLPKTEVIATYRSHGSVLSLSGKCGNFAKSKCNVRPRRDLILGGAYFFATYTTAGRRRCPQGSGMLHRPAPPILYSCIGRRLDYRMLPIVRSRIRQKRRARPTEIVEINTNANPEGPVDPYAPSSRKKNYNAERLSCHRAKNLGPKAAQKPDYEGELIRDSRTHGQSGAVCCRAIGPPL